MNFLATDERLLIWTANLSFSLAFIFGLIALARSKRYSHIILLTLIVTGFIFQNLGLYQRGLETGSCPLGNPFEIIQFISWTIILIYLVIGPAFRMSLLGFFSAGLASTLGIISLLVKKWDYPYDTSAFGNNPWIETHASMAIFSYGVFATLTLTSMMYLVQNYGLKHKRFKGMFIYLPSILQLDHMNNRLLFTGVVVLTFALIVGIVNWVGEVGQIQNPKLIITLAVWLAYLIVLVLRKLNRLLSNNFAWTCLVLFTAALLSLWPIESSRAFDEKQSSVQVP